jgi:hypothetical protein
MLRFGLVLALLGALLSGPVALLVVELSHPQPSWQGAAAFAASYHPIQQLPFWLGLSLVGGLLTVIAGLHRLAEPPLRAQTGLAQLLAAAFAALIFLNYVVQIAFVPVLTRPFHPENAALVSALTMSNPTSLAWGLEMWGYGLLGVSTWLSAPVLRADAWVARAAAACFVANGPISILGAIATAYSRTWLLTPAGLASFGLWNLLLVVMCGLALAASRGPVVPAR